MTEQELHEMKAPWPKSMGELTDFIQSMLDIKHDYGSCPEAMALASEATFNFIAGQLGVTGFQAGWASMQLLRRTKSIEGPFMILRGHNVLFPQYDLAGEALKFIDETTRGYGRTEAIKKLERENLQHVAGTVEEHWRKLAAQPEPEK